MAVNESGAQPSWKVLMVASVKPRPCRYSSAGWPWGWLVSTEW